METTLFVVLAYVISGGSLFVLCISSVLRARAVNRQLQLSAGK